MQAPRPMGQATDLHTIDTMDLRPALGTKPRSNYGPNTQSVRNIAAAAMTMLGTAGKTGLHAGPGADASHGMGNGGRTGAGSSAGMYGRGALREVLHDGKVLLVDQATKV